MKTEFIEYLAHLNDYNCNILQESKAAVANALQGDFEKLKHLFFDFPFYYNVELNGETVLICVVPYSKRERWIQKYEELLLSGDFECVTNAGHPFITASPETVTKVAMLNTDILITACVDLLDSHGNLKQEIIDYFELQPLLASYQQDTKAMSQIIHYIIYSYWMEIVNVSLSVIALQHDCNIMQLEYLNGFAKSMLLDHTGFTPFFMAKLAEYAAKFSENDLAVYLRDLPVSRITGVVRIEMNSIDDIDIF